MNQRQIPDLWNKILTEGQSNTDRTGVGTKSIFGGMLEFDLRERFPLLTIKKTAWKSAFIEMLWFLRGESNTSYLKAHNVSIWDDWADKDGNVGNIYGVQWRKWKKTNIKHYGNDSVEHLDGSNTYFKCNTSESYIDQIKNVIDKLKNNPNDRRILVTAYNVGELDQMSLPPCHWAHSLYVTNDGAIDMLMHLRSSDVGIGLPFNVAQYAMLLHLYGRASGLAPRYLKICYGNAHIYNNQIDKLSEILKTRDEISCNTKLVFKTDNIDIDGYKIEDFDIEEYKCHPFVKLDIAV